MSSTHLLHSSMEYVLLNHFNSNIIINDQSIIINDQSIIINDQSIIINDQSIIINDQSIIINQLPSSQVSS